MERIAKILMAAGLVLMLCAPAVALAQNGPMLTSAGCFTPKVDGVIEELWWDKMVPISVRRAVTLNDQVRVGDVYLGLVNNERYVYGAVQAEWLPMQEPTASQDLFFGLLMAYDVAPRGWNLQTWPGAATDGWFLFFALPPEGPPQEVPPPMPGTHIHLELHTEAGSVGRVGGVQADMPTQCIDGIEGNPAYLTHAATADAMWESGGDVPPDHVLISFEFRIDTRDSNLKVPAGDCWDGLFAALALIGDGDNNDGNTSIVDPASLRDLSLQIAENGVGFGALGIWPDAEDLLDCADERDLPEPDEHCDWLNPCFGPICTTPCVEFVPEPGTLLLLSGGLMGLGGYVTLRLRKR